MIDFDKIDDLSFMIEDYDFKKNKKICVKYKKKRRGECQIFKHL